MFKIFLLLFIAIPLAELYVLIEVGHDIGGIATIALCLLTAALGGWLIRIQGLSTLVDAQHRMARGELPAEHGLHGVMLAMAGLMLFLPGFITDTIGFLLLIPPLRSWIIRRYWPVGTQQREQIIEAEIVRQEHHLP